MSASLGLTIPLGAPLARHAGLLEELVDAGYDQLWTAETAGADAFTPLAHAAAVAPGARLGTAIASVFTRGPALLAMSAAGVEDAAPGRFALGIGASSPAIVTGWNGMAYERPLARVRDTIRFLRAAFTGERVDLDLDTLAVRGFRLERPPAVAPPILIGALRPRMLRLAGEQADGAILNWLSAADVATVAPYVSGGEIAARVFVCPSTDAAAVRRGARRLVAGYLTVGAYADFHRWLGRGELLEPMWAAWRQGDRRAAAAAVPDEVVDALFVHGTPEECARGVERYRAAGVDTPIVKVLALDPALDAVAGALAIARAAA